MNLRILSSLLLAIASILCASAQINIERALSVGRNALFYDDYVLAIQYFNQIIEAKPKMAEPYLLRAIAKYNLDDYHGAEADASAALERNPFLPDAWEVRAVTRQNLGKTTEAISDYKGALRQLPLNIHLLFNMAIAQNEAGLYSEADSTFAVLLKEYPRFDKGYVGRAQLCLERGDTASATADLSRALEINPASGPALVLRSMVKYNAGDYQPALNDIEEAIRLQPSHTALRINRAVLRYKLDDLNGALADFNYVIDVDPLNSVALYNRALLRAELNDNDRAAADLGRVISLDPNDLRARYNRAVILAEKRDTEGALADINAVIDAYPAMESAYGLRSHIYHLAGDESKARADAKRSMQLARRPVDSKPEHPTGDTDRDKNSTGDNALARFNTLLTINTDSETEPQQQFNNGSIRGRVQDHDVRVEIQPIYTLSYYVAGSANDNGMLNNDVYVREIADINDSRSLNFVIHVTNSLPSFTRSEDIDRHFESIRNYGSAIAAGNPRAIDYFGRAMDHMTVYNYDEAIADLDKAIGLTPDFASAWFLRSVARYRIMEARRGEVTDVTSEATERELTARNKMAIEQMLSDLDHTIKISPAMAPAWFNRGTILLMMHDYQGAIEALNHAIEIDPDMAAAWFNRGYAHYSIGDRDAATADISRAGQLGILSGYNLLKRMK